jgi:hypothetical protein
LCYFEAHIVAETAISGSAALVSAIVTVKNCTTTLFDLRLGPNFMNDSAVKSEGAMPHGYR